MASIGRAKLRRTPEGSNDQAISRRLRGGPDLRLWTSAGRQGADQEIRSRIRSSALHLDEDAARDTIFRGLVASGGYTVALTMRLVDSEFNPAGGIVAAGIDELRWPLPVRPGDELQMESEVLEVRPSQSRRNRGMIKVRTTTLNQNGKAVQVFVANLIVLRREARNFRQPGADRQPQ
jgi:acyl dehydratase